MIEEQNIPSACAAAIDWLEMEGLVFEVAGSIENAKMARHTAKLIEQLRARVAPTAVAA